MSQGDSHDVGTPAEEELCRMSAAEKSMSLREYRILSEDNEKYRRHLQVHAEHKQIVEAELAETMVVLRDLRERMLPMKSISSAECALVMVARRICSACDDLQSLPADINISELDESQADELASRIHRETGLIAICGYLNRTRTTFTRGLPALPGATRVIRINVHRKKGHRM
jgi:hypothetical protein